ncbi:hypothetical protein A3A76_00950 [Candidatus Woesebacteria bacterium RIFCSPLOWO2_01_FULL_39_23]|uniref:Response regulatory domain-containing protein n=1 Tax=Candidatus Woesebacteria bacterium RIFCSPHIGHO2_01_FULL_40_22 TaxID=1802499 RepID=A0A1F7YIU3_9BACT|nr:MAG: hypothetical protein A2141_05595 [Candidatus Woesebacteria bacterium RBG_16_40_11]OGM26809.1 MAG: hypothetical protein A2628_04625 [Candidatus Woesebacteria bacterium RIFCSPHIGHO2_01_FULL_40_22]OGM38379.1 MAG: hypothetical protein A3E41_02440 [Candidatus Woesebacteria bacterium RIFCSPHIGHO2_12_FULL_38_9]OGM63106.1 MAG: hypothetical protein A3A76_00950 [Candidatus Woesebacteria bacterium RIFCSPLOWO2_01_FULL_39_23]
MEREPLFKVIKPRLRQRISDPIKISYVDDDKWAVDGQTNILSRKGYEVTGFQVIYRPGVRIQEKQIETLIEKIAQSSMLSIVDLGLGSINTHALLDNLKSKGVLTIILTGAISRAERLEEFEGVSNLILSKPLRRNELDEAIKKVLHIS